MRTACLFFLALSLQHNSNPVEAGVIVTADSAPSINANAPSCCAVPAEEQPNPSEFIRLLGFGRSSGLSGCARVSQSNVRIVAVSQEYVGIEYAAQICWRLAIEDSLQPRPPSLDDLLKPS